MLVHMLALDSSYVSTGYILSVMLIESAMLVGCILSVILIERIESAKLVHMLALGIFIHRLIFTIHTSIEFFQFVIKTTFCIPHITILPLGIPCI